MKRNTHFVKITSSLAAPSDYTGSWGIPDVCNVNFKVNALMKRCVCVETYAWIAEIKGCAVFSSDFMFIKICADNRYSDLDPLLTPSFLSFLDHKSPISLYINPFTKYFVCQLKILIKGKVELIIDLCLKYCIARRD